MLSYWKFIVTVFLLTAFTAGIYLYVKRDDFTSYISELVYKRELKVGDNLSSLRFPEEYHATGVLRLVTSNINEPFEIWYSKPKRKSRIDYYNGDVKTFQRGDLGKHGMFFKMVPKYSFKSKKHWLGCWKRYGVKKRKITAQNVLPHNASWPFKSKLVDFKYVGDAHVNGKLCTKWTYQVKVFEKKNSYAFYASKTDPPLPVRLEMNGYDTLLVSYYDNYVIDYHSFNKWHYDKKKFKIPHLRHDKWCWDTSKMTRLGDGAIASLNPMGEFASLGHLTDPIDQDFNDFKNKHKKVYKDTKEHQKRKHIFRHNIRYIRSMNRKDLNYRLRSNHFADLTDEEFRSYKGDLDDSDDIHDDNNRGNRHGTNDDDDNKRYRHLQSDDGDKRHRHVTNDDDGNRRHRHGTNDDDNNRGHRHGTNDDDDSRGHRHGTNDDDDNRGHRHGTNDDDDSRGHRHGTNDDDDSREHTHGTNDDDDSRGHRHGTNDDDDSRGHRHGTNDDDDNKRDRHLQSDDGDKRHKHGSNADNDERRQRHVHNDDNSRRNDISRHVDGDGLTTDYHVRHRNYYDEKHGHDDDDDDSYYSNRDRPRDDSDRDDNIGDRRSRISHRPKKSKTEKKVEFKIPDELDWRKYGAVNPPKGQGTCGSCWAFAASGAIEGANFIKNGKLENLSEQQLLDCTWFTPGVKKGNNGCLGGWTWKAFSWVKKFGLATTKSYGPYRGQEGYCKMNNLTTGATIKSYRRVKHYNAIALKKAISYHGPATISINANPKSLKFYSSGVLDDVACSNKTDHAVLLIGYGKEGGIPYWLVKNSWSNNWGDHGFIKIKQGLCGIEKRPFVVLNSSKKPLPWQMDKNTKKDEIFLPEKQNDFDRNHHYW